MSLIFCIFHQILIGIKDDERGGVCSTHESDVNAQESKDLKEREHLRDKHADGKIILKNDFKEIGFENVDWVHLAQDKDQWRSLANTAMTDQLGDSQLMTVAHDMAEEQNREPAAVHFRLRAYLRLHTYIK
jgi:phage pi2 protein 07